MVRYNELSEEQKKELMFTPEERKQLDEARKKPIVYDADCPAVTPEKALRFQRVNHTRHIKGA
ncbi:MAG: hypothetical protein IKR68_09920 [Lachnospiraceae bacterium]|nr:hypothetical protein [Lachnospiraceae bacterium]